MNSNWCFIPKIPKDFQDGGAKQSQWLTAPCSLSFFCAFFHVFSYAHLLPKLHLQQARVTGPFTVQTEVLLLLIWEFSPDTQYPRRVPARSITNGSQCSLYRWDRNKDSGKSAWGWGGCLCIYMHDDWSTHNLITHSPDIEYICVKSQLFYLPRELTAVLTTAVYILSDANISIALSIVRHHKYTTTILPWWRTH